MPDIVRALAVAVDDVVGPKTVLGAYPIMSTVLELLDRAQEHNETGLSDAAREMGPLSTEFLYSLLEGQNGHSPSLRGLTFALHRLIPMTPFSCCRFCFHFPPPLTKSLQDLRSLAQRRFLG